SAPRWTVGRAGERITSIDYDVDVKRMEREIPSASDSSKIRTNYVGLLGYSIFAFLENHEGDPIRLEIATRVPWQVFSTLAPQIPAPNSNLTATAPDYYALADSQILMGDKLKLSTIPGKPGSVPLLLAAYAETTDEDLEHEGILAREA